MKEDDFYIKRFLPWFEDDVVLDFILVVIILTYIVA